MAELFAGALGYSNEEYLAIMPRFTLRPKKFKNRFDIPLLVETRIPLPEFLKICEINKSFDNQIEDWGEKTPTAPYVTWANDGIINLGKTFNIVRKNLKPDERGGTIYDGIALCLQNPEIRKNLVLPGSKVGDDDVLYFSWVDGRSKLYCNFVDDACSVFGSVVCGKI